MSNEINLLGTQGKQGTRPKKIIKAIQIASVICMIAVAVTTTVLFIMQSQAELPYLQNEENALSSKLKSMQDKIDGYLVIKERLGNISSIVTQRSAFDVLIVDVIQSVSQEVHIDTFAINVKSVRITLSSHSLLELGRSMDNLVTLTNSKKQFKKITMTAFSFDSSQAIYVSSILIDTF